MFKNFFYFSLSTCFFVLFFYLGTWQLKKYFLKKTTHSLINSSSDAIPILFDTLSYEEKKSLPPYTKILLKGNFMKENIVLYGARYGIRKKDQKSYLFSAFITTSGENLGIIKGWTEYNQTPQKNLPNTCREEKEIIALTIPYEKKSKFIPQNDLSQDIWFTLDSNTSKKRFNISFDQYYLLLQDIVSPKMDININWNLVKKITLLKISHLEYAITWYIFSFIVLFLHIYLYNCRQIKKIDRSR